MTLITLTDGGANSSFNNKMMDTGKGLWKLIWVTIIQLSKLVKNNIHLKTKIDYYRSYITTGLLLDIIKKSHNVSM